ncbi:MAG TPA: hypothetical protein PLI10_06275 [Bacillota bacterium]|nr:hypothetical protein [Bacillota bacterium]HNZ08726.1 hypothetical protein [Bacillota bacterium]HOH10442.1 hypothetical protein [Bacillota bacterium]HOS51005.1 hypothetical protein [Bacillota bacterium]HOY88795.1 hypothetical protein [Bacillota bacterium]
MRRFPIIVAIMAFILGTALIVAGGLGGEFRAIYLNATILCLSCIGVQ